jgi:hypothetical protein
MPPFLQHEELVRDLSHGSETSLGRFLPGQPCIALSNSIQLDKFLRSDSSASMDHDDAMQWKHGNTESPARQGSRDSFDRGATAASRVATQSHFHQTSTAIPLIVSVLGTVLRRKIRSVI